jgi:hypothetical protein
MLNLLAGLLGLAAGALSGRRLAGRGVTAANALEGRQGLAWGILLAVAGGFALIYFRDSLSLIAWLPAMPLLLLEESVWPAVTALGAFALGLLLTMEWPGRRDARRLRTMATGAVVILLALTYLGWRMLPIEGLVRGPLVESGVVMQTTSYTCAPATIATLVRHTGRDTTITELAVVTLARTTREGTSTLAEIRAMRILGLEPRFARRLTPESLVAVNRRALLHVNEPVGSATIRHAVALLEVDPAARTVVIGNPLHGRQVRPFAELRGYWTGEAVFVGAAAESGSGRTRGGS